MLKTKFYSTSQCINDRTETNNFQNKDDIFIVS